MCVEPTCRTYRKWLRTCTTRTSAQSAWSEAAGCPPTVTFCLCRLRTYCCVLYSSSPTTNQQETPTETIKNHQASLYGHDLIPNLQTRLCGEHLIPARISTPDEAIGFTDESFVNESTLWTDSFSRTLRADSRTWAWFLLLLCRCCSCRVI